MQIHISKRSRNVSPFGHRLSYTEFTIAKNDAISEKDNKISVPVTITNTGKIAGKQTAQIYYSVPQGVLGKPVLELATFTKTNLLAPKESQKMTITFK